MKLLKLGKHILTKSLTPEVCWLCANLDNTRLITHQNESPGRKGELGTHDHSPQTFLTISLLSRLYLLDRSFRNGLPLTLRNLLPQL
jgi:hypothetical protein